MQYWRQAPAVTGRRVEVVNLIHEFRADMDAQDSGEGWIEKVFGLIWFNLPSECARKWRWNFHGNKNILNAEAAEERGGISKSLQGGAK